MLGLRSVTFRYPGADTPVLTGLDFRVESGRSGIIGANGCGKTTLLQLLVGLLAPQSGELVFRGQPVQTREQLRNLRREVGFLFQNADDQLFSPTVIEDVAFGPLNLGLTPDEARARAEMTLQLLGLADYPERVTHRLSGGEKRLVALATILSMEPSLLLLDEPTNDLDPATRLRLIDILKMLPQPMVIISHDWDFLSQTTTGLFEVSNGRIQSCRQEKIHVHEHIHKAGDHPHHHEP